MQGYQHSQFALGDQGGEHDAARQSGLGMPRDEPAIVPERASVSADRVTVRLFGPYRGAPFEVSLQHFLDTIDASSQYGESSRHPL